MTKTDQSIHNICIAAIKRSTFKPYKKKYKWAQFYEATDAFPYTSLPLQLEANELIICSLVLDTNNYSILTTRKLITNINGNEEIGSIKGASDKDYGRFKNNPDVVTFGTISYENGKDLKYFIEIGNGSMVMIQGVKMAIRTNEMTAQNIANVTRVWAKQSEQRLEERAQPAENQKQWIIAGYIFACLGGLLGIIIGYYLWTSKKTLPNGQKVPSYTESDRKHGKYIFYIGLIVAPTALIIKTARFL